MEWVVTSGVIATLVEESAAALPRVACGLLLGRAGRIESAVPARNIATDPLRAFEIDPAVLFAAHRAARAGGPLLAGYYHSHPTGVAAPSPCDRRQAPGDGRIWAIVADGRIGWWRDIGGDFAAIAVQITQ